MSERILLIGSGGREHALARKLRHSESCEQLWCAPGNPGIADFATVVEFDVNNADVVVKWCQSHNISLVVIGPEQPLANGLADALREYGIDVFGPSKRAAALETSKGFAKDFMLRHNIPTAKYKRFTINGSNDARVVPQELADYITNHTLPIVIKYDGLAAGKGVVVAVSHDEAMNAVTDMCRGAFGSDGIVVEGFLKGREVSVFAITDGTNYVVLAPSQDHKRIGEGNTGKNTGGMGAYSPVPWVDDILLTIIKNKVIEPTIRGMSSEGNPFVGCLYCGLMIDERGEPSVVEYNARFGDPETQAVLSVLDADFAALLASAARGRIDTSAVSSVSVGFAVNVVIASAGYPDAYEKGHVITGIGEAESDPYVIVYHAGTQRMADSIITSGGRVLGVTAQGSTINEARSRAYAACAKIEFDGKYLRKDIAS